MEVKDAQGNTVTSSSASITVALGANPAGGTLSGTRTISPFNGVATFDDLSVNKVGTGYTLKASAGTINTTSTGFDVAAGPAAKLSFRTAPASGTAGAVLGSVQVELQDAYGNLLTGSTAQVSLSLGGAAGGTLGGTTTVAAVGGVATFNTLLINQAATGYTLTASAAGVPNLTSGAFDIAPAAAAQLAFTVQPSNSVAGASITPAVKVALQDAFGNFVTSETQSITLSLGANASGATLSGTTTATTVNGVATFSGLSIARAGSGYTLLANGTGLASATSSDFSVVPGVVSALAFQVQPSNTTAGAAIAPAVTVELKDAQGNTVTASSASVTVSLGTNPAGGTLSGTKTINALNGVATFDDLSVNKVGHGLHAEGLGGHHQHHLHWLRRGGGSGGEAELPHGSGQRHGGRGARLRPGGAAGCLRQPAHRLHGAGEPEPGRCGRRHAGRHHHGGGGGRCGHLQHPAHQPGGHGLHADGQRGGRAQPHQRRVRHRSGGGGTAGLHGAAEQQRGGRPHHPSGEGGPAGCLRELRDERDPEHHAVPGGQRLGRHPERHRHGDHRQRRGHLR